MTKMSRIVRLKRLAAIAGELGSGAAKSAILPALLAAGLTMGFAARALAQTAVNVCVNNKTGKVTFLSNSKTACKSTQHIDSIGATGPAGPAGPVGPTGPTGPASPNPLRLGLLKWTPYLSQTIADGTSTGPQAVAFDGKNIWVASSDGNVNELNPVTGATIGSPIAVGGTPNGIAFDGINIWVTNGTNETRINTNTLVPTVFTAVANTSAVAVGAGGVWITDSVGDKVTELNPNTGTAVGPADPVGTTPVALASDGPDMWVVNKGSNNVTKLKAIGGAFIANVTVGTAPDGIAFDGNNVWVANSGDGTVTELKASDGTNVGLSPFAVGASPAGVLFDGNDIWVANSGAGTVSQVAPNGTVLFTLTVGTTPTGLGFDGSSVFVANSGAGTLNKL